MSIKNISALFILFLIIVSCTDVVDVQVSDGGNRLVVEADIEWEKGTAGQIQTISLSQSTTYFVENENTPITGAIVTVEKSDDGTIFNFVDQNNGTYSTSNFIPELNQSYTLEIQWDGKVYTAEDSLKPVPEITRIVQDDAGGFEGNETVVSLYFNDPAGTKDYYLSNFSASHRPLNTLVVLDDQFSDGQENFLEYEDENTAAGVVVDYTLQGISSGYYNYMAILIEQSGSDDGGPFQTTPVQLKGNCKNVDDDTEEVLGFFRLSEVVKGQYVIE